MTGRPGELDLAELRTVVLRAREDLTRLTSELREATRALAPELEQARRERLEAEREFLEAFRNGQLEPGQRDLARRLDRGETTWERIAHGEDQDPTAVRFREQAGEELAATVATLRTLDPDFPR